MQVIREQWMDGSIGVSLIVLGDNLVELVKKHTLVVVGLVVYVQRMQHLQNFLVVGVVTCQARQLLQLIVVDEIVFIFVDQFEDSLKSLFGLNIANSRSHQFDKLFEVDRFVLDSKSINDIIDESSLSSFSKFLHDFADFFWVDGARMVDVKQIEGISELFVIIGVNSIFPGGGCRSFNTRGGGLQVSSSLLGCSTHIFKAKQKYIFIDSVTLYWSIEPLIQFSESLDYDALVGCWLLQQIETNKKGRPNTKINGRGGGFRLGTSR